MKFLVSNNIKLVPFIQCMWKTATIANFYAFNNDIPIPKKPTGEQILNQLYFNGHKPQNTLTYLFPKFDKNYNKDMYIDYLNGRAIKTSFKQFPIIDVNVDRYNKKIIEELLGLVNTNSNPYDILEDSISNFNPSEIKRKFGNETYRLLTFNTITNTNNEQTIRSQRFEELPLDIKKHIPNLGAQILYGYFPRLDGSWVSLQECEIQSPIWGVEFKPQYHYETLYPQTLTI